MARKSRNTALAVVLQTARGTFDACSTADLVTGFSNCRLAIDGITVADDTYTGSVFTNADAIAGKRVTLSGNLKLKPPSSLPAADAFVLGRILQAAKFTELRVATAIPASAEAVGVSGNDTTHLALSTGATGTDDLYNMYPILNETAGAAYKDQLTMIRDYVGSTKLAELMETLGGAPADDYQIPPFLGYYRDVTSAEPDVLSCELWIDGFRTTSTTARSRRCGWCFPRRTRTRRAIPSSNLRSTARSTRPKMKRHLRSRPPGSHHSSRTARASSTKGVGHRVHHDRSRPDCRLSTQPQPGRRQRCTGNLRWLGYGPDGRTEVSQGD